MRKTVDIWLRVELLDESLEPEEVAKRAARVISTRAVEEDGLRLALPLYVITALELTGENVGSPSGSPDASR